MKKSKRRSSAKCRAPAAFKFAKSRKLTCAKPPKRSPNNQHTIHFSSIPAEDRRPRLSALKSRRRESSKKNSKSRFFWRRKQNRSRVLRKKNRKKKNATAHARRTITSRRSIC